MPFIKQDYRTNYIASSEGRSFYKQALRKNKIKAATITSAVGYLMMSVDELKADRKGNGDLELEVAKLRAQVLERFSYITCAALSGEPAGEHGNHHRRWG